MAIQEFKLKQDIAISLIKVFDTPDGQKVLTFLEGNVKQRFPNYENINLHMAISGQLQFIEAIRVFINVAKRQIEKERQEQNEGTK